MNADISVPDLDFVALYAAQDCYAHSNAHNFHARKKILTEMY